MSPLPRGVRRAFRLARRKPAVEREVDAEVAFHLEMRVAELVAGGLSPDAARAEALRRFGDTQRWSNAMSIVDRERLAGERRTEWLDDLRQDLRFAGRTLLRTPLFSLLAVLTLALGIGANAAVFGVLKSVLLDALPYDDPGRVVRIYSRLLDGSVDHMPLSAGSIADMGARQRSFVRVAAFTNIPRDAVFAGEGDPRVVKVAFVEPALFATLGVPAQLGRLLRDDDATSDTAYQVVITHGAWQQLFGGDRGIVGRSVRINDIPRTIVGVLPRGFVSPASDAQFFYPLSLRLVARNAVYYRRQHWLGVVARLKPGVTVDAANREVTAMAADLAREYPPYNGSETANVVPVHDDMVGDTRTPLLVLMASAGLVLLITCANLAGALLSRTLSRRKEFAVRVALGAGRGRLVRQLLTESTLLALAGGAAGIALAAGALAALRGLALRTLPPYAELSLDPGALAVTTLLALATGIGFGLAPALSVSRSDPQGSLREETRGASESQRSRRLRGALVAGQIAICVSLLAGAGLLVRSLMAMMAAPLGFDADGVLAVPVQLPNATYRTTEVRAQFFEQFEERLRALPGVTDVGSTGDLPTRVMSRNGFAIEGEPPAPSDARPLVYYNTASDNYFRTLGIPLIAGRTFGPQDRAGGPPVVIISESMARHYWPRGNAVGARINLDPDNPNGTLCTVIGVVGNVQNGPVRAEPEPMLYDYVRSNPFNGPIFMVRTRGEPLALLGAVRRELAAVDPALPIHDATTLRAVVAEGLAGRRLPVLLMITFGGLALLLASVGVYAMFAAMAAAREREFGVRVALGSTPWEIAALVLRQGGVWMAVGLAGGALGVMAVARLVRSLLFGVPPFDAVALGTAVALFVVCGAVALLVPVRRATRVDPIGVLR